MSLEIQGKLMAKLPEMSGESKNGAWKKQDFIIETQGQYPKKICFSVWSHRVEELSKYAEGCLIKVFFEPESREYNGRWYTDLRAWRLEEASMTVQNDAAKHDVDNEFKPKEKTPDADSQDEELPF